MQPRFHIHNAMDGIKEFQLLVDNAVLENFSALIGCPEALTQQQINMLGTAYLNKYPEKKSCMPQIFHTLQPLARELARYSQLVSSQERWNYLVNVYSRLPNVSGNLAATLLYLFRQAFNRAYTITHFVPVPLAGQQLALRGPGEVAGQLQASVDHYYEKKFKHSPHNTKSC